MTIDLEHYVNLFKHLIIVLKLNC